MSDQTSSKTPSLSKAIQEVVQNRLTSNKPIRASAQSTREYIQPSGPRDRNEGIDDQEQGIYHIELLDDGKVVMYVTMLAAGFVIGSRGFSIRQICELAQSQIKSETIRKGRPPTNFDRTVRLFEISGTTEQCHQTLKIIVAAVDLYKKLTEGEMQGQRVQQIQYAEGVAFIYQPPPHRLVPSAAQLVQSEVITTTKSLSNSQQLGNSLISQGQFQQYNYHDQVSPKELKQIPVSYGQQYHQIPVQNYYVQQPLQPVLSINNATLPLMEQKPLQPQPQTQRQVLGALNQNTLVPQMPVMFPQPQLNTLGVDGGHLLLDRAIAQASAGTQLTHAHSAEFYPSQNIAPQTQELQNELGELLNNLNFANNY